MKFVCLVCASVLIGGGSALFPAFKLSSENMSPERVPPILPLDVVKQLEKLHELAEKSLQVDKKKWTRTDFERGIRQGTVFGDRGCIGPDGTIHMIGMENLNLNDLKIRPDYSRISPDFIEPELSRHEPAHNVSIITGIDFSGSSFKNVSFSSEPHWIIFKGCAFRNVDFEDLDLSRVHFINCDLKDAKFKNIRILPRFNFCLLQRALFIDCGSTRYAIWFKSDLRSARFLGGSKFLGVFKNFYFSECDLRGAIFKGKFDFLYYNESDVRLADFSVEVDRASFDRCSTAWAAFRGRFDSTYFNACAMQGAKLLGWFNDPYLKDCELVSSTLAGEFINAFFVRCNFSQAVVQGKFLDRTVFNDSDLRRASFEKVQFSGETSFNSCEFAEANFKEAVMFGETIFNTNAPYGANFEDATIENPVLENCSVAGVTNPDLGLQSGVAPGFRYFKEEQNPFTGARLLGLVELRDCHDFEGNRVPDSKIPGIQQRRRVRSRVSYDFYFDTHKPIEQ